jgi:fluoride exporter
MEPFVKILSIAIGGAFGAVARHLVNISPLARTFDNFPLPTFLINVVGSFLIGFLLILLSDRFVVSENWRLAVIVGFLGAFTTFSTFEIEIYGLASERAHMTALLYLLLSIVGGFIAVVAGVRIARLI